MKKLLTTLCSLILVFVTAFMLVGCGNGGSTTFAYIALQNNTEGGFTTDPEDTAIAVGLKKDSELLAPINTYLSTLTKESWSDLMQKMVNICSKNNATYTPDADGELLTTGTVGTLKVAMECGYEPFNWTQKNSNNGAVSIANVPGKYANGYDVQMARKIAKALNMKLEIYQCEWDSLVPGIETGTYDLICAGMSPTAERKAKIDFSNNYYESNLVIVTKQGSKIINAKSIKDFDKQGIKIAAQPGTSHLLILKAQTSKCTVIDTCEDFPAMRMALTAGTIDGFVAEEPTAMSMIAENNK